MNHLSSLKGLLKKRKRIGRGGSRGGTSGRGNKGQKARTGHSAMRASFEGGQMPLVRRLPKRGFNNKAFQRITEIINVQELESSFVAGQEVNRASLLEKGLIKGRKGSLIKILGTGSLLKKLIVSVDAISSSAREAIEKCGGTIQLI